MWQSEICFWEAGIGVCLCERYPPKFFLPPNENAMRAQMGRLQVDGMIDDEGGSVASGYHNSFRGTWWRNINMREVNHWSGEVRLQGRFLWQVGIVALDHSWWRQWCYLMFGHREMWLLQCIAMMMPIKMKSNDDDYGKWCSVVVVYEAMTWPLGNCRTMVYNHTHHHHNVYDICQSFKNSWSQRITKCHRFHE